MKVDIHLIYHLDGLVCLVLSVGFLPQWAKPLVLPPLLSPAAETLPIIQLHPLSHTNIVIKTTFAQILGLD